MVGKTRHGQRWYALFGIAPTSLACSLDLRLPTVGGYLCAVNKA